MLKQRSAHRACPEVALQDLKKKMNSDIWAFDQIENRSNN
jgi:hypothetical protein